MAQLTLEQGQRSMHMAALVVLLVNAEDILQRGAGVSKRELALASDVISEGRALLVVANKLDACSQEERIQVGLHLAHCDILSWQVLTESVLGAGAPVGAGGQEASYIMLNARACLYIVWTGRLGVTGAAVAILKCVHGRVAA